MEIAAATMSLDEDKSDQIGLATMPVEVLELIFSFVDDTNLLAVSQVCKRFVPIAKHLFEQKYASRSYRMYFVEKKVNHRAILKKFGGKLSGMDINKVDMLRKNRWVLNVIRENATTLNKLALSSIDVDLTWMLACLQNLKSCELAYLNVRDSSWAALALQPLKHIEMVELRGLSDEILVEFFDNNRQLESLSFYSYQLNVLDKIHDRLHMLKHLQVEFAITEDYPSELNVIKLDSLESLDVRFIDYEYSVDNNDVSRVLQAFRNGCTNINQLSVQCHQNSAADDVLTTIYAFDKLKSLDISDVELTSKQLTSLQRKLPNLNAIKVTMVFPFEIDGEDLNQDMIVNEILSILSNSPHLNELSIKISLEDVSVDCFNYDFFTRFSLAIENNRNDIKLNLHSYSWNVFVSRNKIMHKLNHSKPVLIHWTGYEADRSISKVRMSDLNEKNLWSLFDRMEPADLYALQQTSQNMESKVTKYAEENFKHRLLRFSRLDQTFQGLIKHFVKVELKIRGDEWSIIDLAQLPHLESLKITSQKPIAVDSTVLGNEKYFTRLTSLTISQDEDMPIEFLNSIFARVGEQLQRLELNISRYPQGRRAHEVKRELTASIVQFHNLTSLRLGILCTALDTKLLFSTVHKITDLHIVCDAYPGIFCGAVQSKTGQEFSYASKATIKHIQQYCTSLKILQVKWHNNIVPVESVQFIKSQLPNVTIKSIRN